MLAVMAGELTGHVSVADSPNLSDAGIVELAQQLPRNHERWIWFVPS